MEELKHHSLVTRLHEVLPRCSTGDAAFIWTSARGMRNVRDMLISDFGLDLTGWGLRTGTGISDDGQTLTGLGVNPAGDFQGRVATIPEPASAMTLVIGGVALLRARRARV